MKAHWYKWSAISIAVMIGIMLLTLSVMNFRGYNASMLDLGNMSQAIWSVTQGRPLEYTHEDGLIPQFSRLGWHTELLYYLIAPLYKLFPTPITLLTVQAFLFIAGAFPLYDLGIRRLKQGWAALLLVGIYVFYPVAQTAMLWDFHGDTLAMPLMLFVINALDSKDWYAYAFWLVLALSCKVYVAIPVVVLGVSLWLMGQRKEGILTALVGVLWGMMVVLLIRPMFAPPSSATYAQKSVVDYLVFYFDLDYQALTSTFFARLLVLGIIYLPVAIYTSRSFLWMLPAFAVIFPALISNGPGPSYHYVYHHYALAVPFFLAAVVYGAERLRRRGLTIRGLSGHLDSWRLSLGFALVVTLCINVFAVDTPFSPSFWQHTELGNNGKLDTRRTTRDALKDDWLSSYVNDGVPLAISTFMAPHVPNRHILYGADNLFEENIDTVEVALYDALFDKVVIRGNNEFIGGALYDDEKIKLLLENKGFILVNMRDGLLLFEKDSIQRELQNYATVTKVLPDTDETQVDFDDLIRLLSVSVSKIEEQYYQLNFTWTALENLEDRSRLFAVSTIKGIGDARFVHLPSLVMYPTNSWIRGQIITETFDIILPDDLPMGTYKLVTGWYDSANPFAFKTDDRSRVGNEVIVAEIVVE